MPGLRQQTGGETPEYGLDANPHYLAKKDMKLVGVDWKGDGCVWTNQIYTNFWAVYPKTAVGRGDMTWPVDKAADITDAQEKTPSFTYDMTSYSGTRKDASTATQDIMASYARGYWDEDKKTGGTLNFKFKHLLAGIRFRRGHIDSGYNITEIKIGGLHLKGSCSLTGSTVLGKDSLAFVWKGTDSTNLKKSVGLSQTIDATGVKEGKLIMGDTMMFVIPQTMSDSTTMYAVIKKTSGGTAETKDVALTGYSWKPGKRYDYTLSYYENKDEFVVTVKEYTISTGTWTN